MASRSKQVLALISKDPRYDVDEYYVDSDGHWVSLKQGWMFRYEATTCLHEWTAKDMIEAIRDHADEIIPQDDLKLA